MAQTMRFVDPRGDRVFGSSAATSGVLPAGAAGFFKRRLAETLGLVLFGCSFWLIAALFSYTPGDPSLNNAANGAVGNLLGAAGAWFADLSFQAFGFAGVLPPLALLAWGWRSVAKRGLSVWWLRVLMLIFAMTLLATSLNVLPPPGKWPLMTGLGGVTGAMVFDRLAGLGPLLGIEFYPRAVAAVLLVLALAAFIMALGLSWQEWLAFGRALGFGVAALGRGAKRSREAFWVMPAWCAGPEADEDGHEEAFDGDIKPVAVGVGGSKRAAKPVTSTDLVAPKKPRPKAGRKALAERQGKLDLGGGQGIPDTATGLIG